MKIKLKDLKNKTGDIFAEAIIKDKEIIKITSLNDKYLSNGKPFNFDFRHKYKLIFLDKYENGYEYGDIIIQFRELMGFTYKAVVVANFFKRVYLKLLFEQYLFQRLKGLKQIFIGIFIGVISAVVAGLILNLFTCN